jgi:hypothetical protein
MPGRPGSQRIRVDLNFRSSGLESGTRAAKRNRKGLRGGPLSCWSFKTADFLERFLERP